MESAHLTNAHEHVRNAQTATLSSSIATAGDEHDRAAACFHDAAQDTHNDEALRILALLEDHHRKLAGLIKEAPRKPDKKSSAAAAVSERAAATAARASSPSASALRTHRRLPQSSIASNLAEKRGIPSARRTTSGTAVTAAGANAARDGHATPVRDLLERQARRADQSRSRELPQPNEAPAAPPPPEDNFRRFYSAFGGVISAISAPLAFTSLPLHPPSTPAAQPPPPAPTPRAPRPASPEASRTVKSSVPDLAALISKPALRALRSDAATPLNPNESFYLVPPSGGTQTYASMLSGPGALPPITEDTPLRASTDEFVDAHERIQPPSPTALRPTKPPTASTPHDQPAVPAGRGSAHKTNEELQLENDELRRLVDGQATRIQMWETNSQNQFNALAASFRRPAVIPATTTAAHNTGNANPSGNPDADAQLRIDALTAANKQLERQTERDRAVIARYREQWEKLKAGARRKERERGQKDKAEEGEGEGEGDGV